MYLIPRNISTRFEFKDGFGWKELFITLTGAAIGVALFLIIGLFTERLIFRIILLVICIVGGFMLIQPHPLTKQSVLDTIRMQHRFRKSKKLYLYQFGGHKKC